MSKRSPPHKRSPAAAGGGAAGGEKIITPIIPARGDAGKARPVWPQPDHPSYRELLQDRDYVWGRMMASVPGGPA